MASLSELGVPRGPFERPHDSFYGGNPESTPRETRKRITPEDFTTDGNSLQARQFAKNWENSQYDGNLTALIMCGDARISYNPQDVTSIRTIAATVPQELYGNVLNKNLGTRNVVVMAHHDSERVEPGKRPPGCGGRDAKAQLRDIMENPSSEEGALRYVRQRVAHEDPIIGAYSSALEIAETSRLPVLAVTQDHITGKIIPFASFQPTADGGLTYHSPLSLRYVLDEQYDPERIYAEGIPCMDEDNVPSEFSTFLKRHERYIAELKQKNPDYESSQRIQNPDTVLITTVIRPSRGRLPHISGESSNRVFAITVARKGGNDREDVDEQSIIEAADELEYPLDHGLQSEGNPSNPFSSLYSDGTVIIETRNLAKSRRVAEDLLLKPWFKEWAQHQDNRIIIAQTTRGIVDSADYFRLNQ